MNILYNTKNFINSGRKRIREKKIIGFSILLLIVLLFFSTAGFQDRLIQGWYQQWLPDLNGSSIKDITFLDSLTGFAVTNTNSLIEGYVIKTTNSGDNWSIVYTYHPPSTNTYFTRVQFADSNTGYASTIFYDLIKTTDRGMTWINHPNVPWGAEDMAVINKDTILVATTGGFAGGVYRTTNGGSNWQLIWTNGTSGNPNKIYMFNQYLGFHCDYNTSFYTRRTTDGGLTWTNINEDPFFGIAFYDSLIGWKGDVGGIKKTNNGGLNWFFQQTPSFYSFRCFHISVINKDTVWFEGPSIVKNNSLYGVICKTTNAGSIWGYQIPDTSLHIIRYDYMRFFNKFNGWAYFFNNTGVHTNVGGNDTTYISHVNNQIVNSPGDYSLYQNFPNPFNASTEIKYKIPKSADVRISVYNIRGQEIKKLTNKRHSPGIYDLLFDGSNLPSGVYFFQLTINSPGREQSAIRKMVLIK